MNPNPADPPVEDGVDRGLQALVRMLRLLFSGLRLLMVVLLVGLVFSGVFYVKEQEEAMLFRFGRLVPKRVKTGDLSELRETLTSGHWYWAFPYPVDVVKRVQARRSVTITTKQFWPWQNPNQLEGQGGGNDQTALRPGLDGYLLTGDANIMHMIWTLTYRVTDARKYYLRFYEDAAPVPDPKGAQPQPRGGMALIESLLSQAVLAEVATWPVEDVLVLARRDAAAAVGAVRENLIGAVRQRVDAAVEAVGLGIEVQQVSLVEVQPPKATRQAFREVVDAASEYRTQIEDAQAYQKRVETEAEGQAAMVLAEAQQYRDRVVQSVQADRQYFEQVVAEYRRNPDTMLVALYADALREVLDRVETKYVLHGGRPGQQEVRLMIGPEPVVPVRASAEGENAGGEPQPK